MTAPSDAALPETAGAVDPAVLDLPNWRMRVQVSAAATGGRLTAIASEMGPGHPGPFAHVHVEHDECFVLLAGRLRFRVGDEFLTATEGETVFAARGLAHAFSNPFDAPASYVLLLTPSGYEDYFRAVAALVAATGGMPDIDAAAELMSRYATALSPQLADPGWGG